MAFPPVDEAISKINEMVENDAKAAASESETKEPVEAVEAKETQEPDYLDLDSMDKKIKWQGQEYTKEDLNKAFLRQQDYTKKTMELSEQRKQFEENAKYAQSIDKDIQTIIKNPELVDQFLKIYPKQYHGIVEALGLTPTNKGAEIGNGQFDPSQIENAILAKLMPKFEPIVQEYEAGKLAKAEAAIDTAFNQFGKKYEYADEFKVLGRAESLLQKKIDAGQPAELSSKEWESIFKTEHELIGEKIAKTQSNKVQQQKQANQLAKESGSGGGTPTQAPVKMNIQQATKAIMADLQAGKQLF